MSRHHKLRAFLRLARLWFRRVRLCGWCLVLLLLGVLIYLHNLGLPGFAKRAVIEALEERGVTMDVTRIHLAWFNRIEAEAVALQPVASEGGPRMECRRLNLSFEPWSLLRFRVVPRELEVDDGRLIFPRRRQQGVSMPHVITNLQAQIHFMPDGVMHVDTLSGRQGNSRISASGRVANIAQIGDWSLLRRGLSSGSGRGPRIPDAVTTFLDDMVLETAAELSLTFAVDGAAPEQFSASLNLRADTLISGGYRLEAPEMSLALGPGPDGLCSVLQLGGQVEGLATPYGQGEHLTFSTAIDCEVEAGGMRGGRIAVAAERMDTRWAGGGGVNIMAAWTADGTNLLPTTAEVDLTAAQLSGRQGSAENVRIKAELLPATGDPAGVLQVPPSLLPMLTAFDAGIDVVAERITSARISLTNLACEVRWSSPVLDVPGLSVDLAGGHVTAKAVQDAGTGRVEATLASDFDPKRLYAVLPRPAVEWLDQFTWRAPPVATGTISVVLPPWEPGALMWPGNVLPTLEIDGVFEVGPGTFRGVPVLGASSHVTYSNMCWHLPDLDLLCEEGSLRLEHRNDDRAHAFLWRVDGAADPSPAWILLPEDAVEGRAALETLQFDVPPEVHLTLTGVHGDLASLTAWGTVTSSNLAFRGCGFDAVTARLGLTNLVLTLTEPEVTAGGQTSTMDLLEFDFNRGLVFITNGVSHLAPMTIATVIGRVVVEAIEPYRFLEPPEGRVDGVVSLTGTEGTDMRFDVQGGPFHWQGFKLQEIGGRVLWKGDALELSGIEAEFYGGKAAGDAHFAFRKGGEARFRFNLNVEDADIHPLVEDVFGATNELQGDLSGFLSVTQAEASDLGSWFGYGHASLKDGYIWSVPIFGVVSPLLDLFLPGLGSSEAREAEGTFAITNSVIRTEDLVIHTSNMRLLYAGTVDFEANVEAVAEAELLRETVLVGEFISTMLMPLSKAMIVDIGGTLSEPEARPLYIVPRILLAPLSPVRLFKEMFVPDTPKDGVTPSLDAGQGEPAPESGVDDPAGGE